MSYRDDLGALSMRHDALESELAAKTKELDEAARLLEDAKVRAKLPILDNIRIASPCRADWNEMVGDERSRACGSCEKQVFNLSSMTRAEAEALIIEKAGKLCARYYQRYDGTIILADCTLGAAAARRRKLVAAGTAALLATGIGYRMLHRDPKPELDAIDVQAPAELTSEHVTGVVGRETPPPPRVNLARDIQAQVAHDHPLMGAVAFIHDVD